MINPPEASTDLHSVPVPELATTWDQQWVRVPTIWRDGMFDTSQEPFTELFIQHATNDTIFDVRPDGFDRASQEICWWAFITWSEGFRKIDPFRRAPMPGQSRHCWSGRRCSPDSAPSRSPGCRRR